MKTFTYTNITEEVYIECSDEYEYYGDDFAYDADDDEMIPLVARYLYEDYYADIPNVNFKTMYNNLVKMIEDLDLIDKLSDDYYDRLKEDLEDKAKDSYY